MNDESIHLEPILLEAIPYRHFLVKDTDLRHPRLFR
jgi:hypothetical protein